MQMPTFTKKKATKMRVKVWAEDEVVHITIALSPPQVHQTCDSVRLWNHQGLSFFEVLKKGKANKPWASLSPPNPTQPDNGLDLGYLNSG